MYSDQAANAEFLRLSAEYREAVIRCRASQDQLRAAERELSQLQEATGKGCAPECTPEELKQLLQSPTQHTEMNLDGLSDREFEVFALIGKGSSSREIAEHLHITISTVETYRERLKTKLDLSNGHELTRVATIWSVSRRLDEPGRDG